MIKNIGGAFTCIIIICLIGFRIDLMDVDAAQYASMSREMLDHRKYLFLFDGGKDYLDKPPFLFWISALSMKVFGTNNFAYRLPSFLFSLLAVYATFRLAIIYYNRQIAMLAAIILASCQGFFLMNHDVRTDTILMGCVIFSVWQLAAWFKNNKLKHLIAGCTGIAFGMMTKGPIALLVPVFAFGSDIVLHRNFKALFKWQYILGLVIIALLLLPMCVGLCRQFDLHPEKYVNFQTGVSGLRFFFWTQSFGRITGESYWNNHSNIFTLLKNMLWSFLPWILFFFISFYIDVKRISGHKFLLAKNEEAITTGGFLLTYISLGLSKYQLPHYIFVVFPLAAIITAKFIYLLVAEQRQSRLYKFLFNFHLVLMIILWLALQALLYLCFATIPLVVPVIASLLFLIFIAWIVYQRKNIAILPSICLVSILSINLFLNLSFYPALLKYQLGNTAGRWLAEHRVPKGKIFSYKLYDSRSLYFYAGTIVLHKDSTADVRSGDWIITAAEQIDDFESKGIKYDVVCPISSYTVSRLSLKFLNPFTRKKLLERYAIIKIK